MVFLQQYVSSASPWFHCHGLVMSGIVDIVVDALNLKTHDLSRVAEDWPVAFLHQCLLCSTLVPLTGISDVVQNI